LGIRLSDARYEEIKRIVTGMFIKYGVSCIPINGFEIATKMGIAVIPYSAYPPETRHLMLKKSGDGFSAERTDGRWFVFYNDDGEHDYGRINNTIMHEIGHIILDHTEDSNLAESEVKFFAKYALAPPVLIHKLELSDSWQVMDRFEVSYTAACYAFSYYQKWLRFGGEDYKDYELVLLNQFKEAV
jgi:Zn-dependent peptidase ImmA (M78 family)